MLFAVALKRKRENENEFAKLALLLVAKFGQLVGTTATRDFTCQRILYRVPAACEFMDLTAAELRSEIKLVELDLTASRCAMIAGKAEAELYMGGLQRVLVCRRQHNDHAVVVMLACI